MAATTLWCRINFGKDATTGAADNVYDFTLSLDETNLSPGDNKSDIAISSATVQPYGPRAVAGSSVSFSWTINWGDGTSTSGSENVGGGTDVKTMQSLAGKTRTYKHNTDGSKSTNVTLSVSGRLWDVWEHTASTSATVTVVLTDFVTSNTVSATDANIGSASTIVVSKFNPAHFYSVQYQMQAGDSGTGKSGYLNSDGTISSTEIKFNKDPSSSTDIISFTLPDDFYYSIPNNKTGMCKITVRTYVSQSDGTPLDFDEDACSYSLIATAAETTCRPVVSGNVSDINPATTALTGGGSVIVKYFSTARVTMHATPHAGSQDAQTGTYGTSIVSRAVNGVALPTATTTQYDISNCELALFDLVATDSRGYVNAPSPVPITLIDYIKLTNNGTVSRYIATENELSINFSGNYFTRWDPTTLDYTGGSFGLQDNTLTLKYRYKIAGGSYPSNYTTVTPVLRNGRYSYSATLYNMPYTNQYVFELVATDKLMSVTMEVPVTRGIPVFDWGANDFNVNGDFTVTADDQDSGNITADGDISTKHDLYVSNQIYYGKDAQGVDIPIEDTYPTQLPNPQTLSWNIGGITGNYNGEASKSISVPIPKVEFVTIYQNDNAEGSTQGGLDINYSAYGDFDGFIVTSRGWKGDSWMSSSFVMNHVSGRIQGPYHTTHYRNYDATEAGHFKTFTSGSGDTYNGIIVIKQVVGVRIVAG